MILLFPGELSNTFTNYLSDRPVLGYRDIKSWLNLVRLGDRRTIGTKLRQQAQLGSIDSSIPIAAALHYTTRLHCENNAIVR